MARKRVEINPKTGERIKIICAEQGITQAKLAEMVGYTPEYISNIVRGRKGLSLEAARLICKAFRAGRKGTMYREEWLLGQDDYQNNQAIIKKRREYQKANEQREYEKKTFCYEAIKLFGQALGYRVEFRDSSLMIAGDDLSWFFPAVLDADKTRSFVEDICHYVEWQFRKVSERTGYERSVNISIGRVREWVEEIKDTLVLDAWSREEPELFNALAERRLDHAQEEQ